MPVTTQDFRISRTICRAPHVEYSAADPSPAFSPFSELHAVCRLEIPTYKSILQRDVSILNSPSSPLIHQVSITQEVTSSGYSSSRRIVYPTLWSADVCPVTVANVFLPIKTSSEHPVSAASAMEKRMLYLYSDSSSLYKFA